MGDPLISILVPVYNGEVYIARFLESVITQSYKNFELIILNDGSSDQTVRVIERYSKDDRITVKGWRENRGLNAAWFHLLTTVNGKFWTSPGADDVLEPDFLLRRVEVLEANQDAGFVHGPPIVIDSTGIPALQTQTFREQVLRIDNCRALELLTANNYINQPGVVARTAVSNCILSKFRTDWRYAPDWFLWILMLSACDVCVWDSRRLHQYRVHTASLSLNPRSMTIRRAENRLVPLCGFAAAAEFSDVARTLWNGLKYKLYTLWLLRAVCLAGKRRLEPAWVLQATQAMYGRGLTRHSGSEILRFLPRLVDATLIKREKAAHQMGLGVEVNEFLR